MFSLCFFKRHLFSSGGLSVFAYLFWGRQLCLFIFFFFGIEVMSSLESCKTS